MQTRNLGLIAALLATYSVRLIQGTLPGPLLHGTLQLLRQVPEQGPPEDLPSRAPTMIPVVASEVFVSGVAHLPGGLPYVVACRRWG